MSPTIDTEVMIARPVEVVFDYIVDLEANGPTWATDLESVEKTSDGPVTSGTTFKQVQTVMGKQRETSLQFTTIVPNQRIDAEAQLGPMAPQMSLGLEAVGEGTRVTAKGSPNPKGVFKLLSPMIARQGRKVWEARLAGLKKALEG